MRLRTHGVFFISKTTLFRRTDNSFKLNLLYGISLFQMELISYLFTISEIGADTPFTPMARINMHERS